MAAVLILASSVEAGGAGSNPPNPAKALLKAAKNLTRARGYRASLNLVGGISSRDDHRVTERTVVESYQGEVFGNLMHVPQARAYRLPQKGVAYVEGAWRNILSSQKTMRIDRLFQFPQIVLQRALIHARSAKWLDTPETGNGDTAETLKKAPGQKRSSISNGGSPTVARRSQEEGKDAWPRIVRITVPPKEALKYFIEAQNSGCMSAG